MPVKGERQLSPDELKKNVKSLHDGIEGLLVVGLGRGEASIFSSAPARSEMIFEVDNEGKSGKQLITSTNLPHGDSQIDNLTVLTVPPTITFERAIFRDGHQQTEDARAFETTNSDVAVRFGSEQVLYLQAQSAQI